MKYLITLLLTLITLPTFAEEKKIVNPCNGIQEKLKNCTPFECNMKHPVEKDATVSHYILGFNKDGKCRHLQSLPDDTVMDCSYSRETLAFLTSDIAPEGTTIEKFTKAIESECSITG